MLPRRRMLGLAVTHRSATAIEVAVAKGAARVLRAAQFVFPDGVGVDEPQRLGQALKEFLREAGFSASRCVIGLDAARLSAREKSLPPASGDSVAQILAIAVEQEFAADHKELLFDYADGTGDDANPSVLLVAAPRRHLDHLVAMAGEAGLAVSAITSSTMALADSANGLLLADRLVLHVFCGGVELAAKTRGGAMRVWRLSVSPSVEPDGSVPAAETWLDEFAHELRRILYMHAGDAAAGPPRELLVWDENGHDPKAWDALARRLDVPVRLCASDEWRGAAAERSAPPGGQYSAATAMALAGIKGRPLPVDFLHSRLAARRPLALRRKMAWGVGVAAAVLLAAGLFVFDLIQAERDVADLETWQAENASSLAAAKDVVAKAAFARAWYRRRPRLLGCLRDLTLAFPADGGIWTTSLSMQEDLRGVVAGKATTESMVLKVLDTLKANPRLSEVKPLYLREAGRGGREVAFAMSFRFVGSE